MTCKNKIEAIYDNTANGAKARSHCDWFEYGEKSSTFFLNLKKHRATKIQICTILNNTEIINNFSEINDSFYNFYQTLFTQINDCLDISAIEVLSKLNIPKLSFEEVQLSKEGLQKMKLLRI